jgi:hypothetical protein
MSVKPGADLRATPFSSYELRENRYSGIFTLRKGVNKMLPHILNFRPIWMKFGTKDLHPLLLFQSELRENRYSERLTSLKASAKFCPCFLHFLSNVDKIRYMRCPQKLELLSTSRFGGNRNSDSHTLFRSVNGIAVRVFHLCCLIWMTFGQPEI